MQRLRLVRGDAAQRGLILAQAGLLGLRSGEQGGR